MGLCRNCAERTIDNDICRKCEDEIAAREDAEMAAEETLKGMGYIVEYSPKEIPIKGMDWTWVHEDYDGPEDGRCGYGRNPVEILEHVRDFYE